MPNHSKQTLWMSAGVMTSSGHPCRESGFAFGSPSSEGTLSGRHAPGMSADRPSFRRAKSFKADPLDERWCDDRPSFRRAKPFKADPQQRYGGCSSVGRASDCGSECRGFESRLPPHKTSRRKGRSVPLRPFAYDRPATLGCSQVVRHGTLTPAFAGSSPAIPAI